MIQFHKRPDKAGVQEVLIERVVRKETQSKRVLRLSLIILKLGNTYLGMFSS